MTLKGQTCVVVCLRVSAARRVRTRAGATESRAGPGDTGDARLSHYAHGLYSSVNHVIKYRTAESTTT